MNAAFRAEALKVRRSAASKLPWVGLAIALLQGSLFMLSPQAIHTWKGLAVWQTLWITFLLPLFLALLAGLTSQREVRAQGGGLWWRAVPWEVGGRAELLWLGVLSLFLNAAVILPTLVFGALLKLPGQLPWQPLLELTVVLTLASLPLLAVGQRFSRRFGLVGGLILAFLGNFSGILTSEKPWWFLNPWAWPIRATFTLSGTSANGLPLSPDSPLWHVSPWPVVALALLTTAGLMTLPVALPHQSGQGKRTAGTLRPWRWSNPLAAELVKYRHTALPWLICVTPVLVSLLALFRMDAHGIWELWILLVLPFAVALMSSMTWGWEADHWRLLRIRKVNPGSVYGAKLLAMWLASLLCGSVLFVLMALIGKPLPDPSLLFSLYALTSVALLAFHLWLAAQLSSGVTLGVGVIMTLLALLLGSTGLGESIWRFFPWVWARILPFMEDVSVWPYLLLLAAMGGLFGWLGLRATERKT